MSKMWLNIIIKSTRYAEWLTTKNDIPAILQQGNPNVVQINSLRLIDKVLISMFVGR